ncbi:hypothetical protein EPN18_01960 [bacterium]|nr:MAG: hypothetical protein EPN18_01960 [bacterium]
MKKEVIITVMLLSLVMPWFGGTARANVLKPQTRQAEASFCSVSATECRHGDACPVHGNKHASHVPLSKHTTSKSDKNKGHCAPYLHCAGHGEAGLPGIFSIKPFLTGGFTLNIFQFTSLSALQKIAIWSDVYLNLPERPPAVL